MISTTRAASAAELRSPLADVVGADLEAPLLDGRTVRLANLDAAATTPALRVVAEAVEALLPWYGSAHRGAGLRSEITTAAVAGARAAVLEFAHARPDDVAVLVRTTTEATNLLAACLPAGTAVVSTAAEHHANLLPWRRRHEHHLLPVPVTPAQLVEDVDRTLAALGRGQPKLVAVTGASNVSGEVHPLAELVRVAHEHGAEVFVDAAQLAPHRALDVAGLDIDYLAWSAHKTYAPYGGAALIGRRAPLDAAEPWLAGGGATVRVSTEGADWATGPARHEAGSPNVVGAVAMGVACDALRGIGFDVIEARERALVGRLIEGLERVPGVDVLQLWPGAAVDRVGVATFTLAGVPDRLLAAILAAEYGIGVRCARFCAHPLVEALLARCEHPVASAPGQQPGAVRASVGLHSTVEDIERLLAALTEIAGRDAHDGYRFDPAQGAYRPTGGHNRAGLPDLPFRLNA